MTRLMLAAGAVVLLLILVAAAAALIGAFLPRGHVVSRSLTVQAPPDVVYRAVRDVGASPAWRTGLARVELLGEVEGRPRFREVEKHGSVTYEVLADEPGRGFVTQILDRDLGYSGSWEWVIVPETSGSRLTITEHGEVTNVLFRFMSRFVFGHAKTIDDYLAALDAHLQGRSH